MSADTFSHFQITVLIISTFYFSYLHNLNINQQLDDRLGQLADWQNNKLIVFLFLTADIVFQSAVRRD